MSLLFYKRVISNFIKLAFLAVSFLFLSANFLRADMRDIIKSLIAQNLLVESDAVNLILNKNSKMIFRDCKVSSVTLEENEIFTACIECGDVKKDLRGEYKVKSKFPMLKEKQKKGAVLTLNMIEMKYIQEPKDLIGKILKKDIPAMKPIQVKDLRNKIFIQKNSIVHLIFRGKNLLISAQGTTLEDGGMDDIIKVRNNSNNKILIGANKI